MNAPRAAVAFGLAAVVAVAVRLHNAVAYPPDWGFDASSNWQYIHALTKTWRLPPVEAAWSTGDPPLYFYLCAALLRIAGPKPVLLPLLNALLGLGVVVAGMALVRRSAPADRERTLLAGGLLLFLPAHIHMSAMVNEELLAAFCTSLVLLAVARPGLAAEAAPAGPRRALSAGLAGGLAMLAKPSGALAVAAAAGAYAWDGWRQRAPRRAALRLAALLGAALLVGGWFYARNQLTRGAPLPFGLPAHGLMFSMPPGERAWLDYVRLPLATFGDPQLLNPDLLHSVWGSTYAAVWFDAHRYFLPGDSEAVRRLGTVTLLLALLPTCAFASGMARGARRCLRGEGGADLPLLLLVLFTAVAYALYTWQNPWFAVLKGTALLGLSLPYAYYASERLLAWARRGRLAALGVGACLAALALCVVLSCTFNGVFERKQVSGLQWGISESE
jgi:4-amino-4-deoxy-L-arabinose transferase-like glycosyltransferase